MKPVAWAHEQGANKLVDAYNKEKHPESFAYFTTPLYTADQLRQAKVEVLREFACTLDLDGMYQVANKAHQLADEIEKGEQDE